MDQGQQGAFQGVLQMNLDGRPDGRRPHDSEFAFDFYRDNQQQSLESESAPDEFQLVRSKGELATLLAARERGEAIVGGIIGTEGSHALDGRLEAIDELFAPGLNRKEDFAVKSRGSTRSRC